MSAPTKGPGAPRPLPPLRFKPARDCAFRRALQAEAEAYLRTDGGHRYADGWVYLKGAGLAGALLASYLLVLRADAALPFALALVACLCTAMALALNMLHDAAHLALFRSDRLNRVVRRVLAVPVGIDADYWTVRHVHFHHTYANIEGYDLDTEPNPFLRQTPFQAWSPQYRYQHLYWPLVAALSLPYLNWYSDWADRLGATPVGAQGNGPGWPLFLTGKLAHVLLMLVLPVWAAQHAGIGWGVALGAYFLGQMLASCVLVSLILGTHWSEVEFFQPGADGAMPHTWYQHSFHTACDWTPRPAWLGYFLGGLDKHLTHHLFPTWNHRHYPALAAIVARLAPQHQLRYRNLGYRQLLQAQQSFLKSMGAPPRTGKKA
ncbi:linoleoyl-CoA desaturase [Janthinobacterium sp. CG_23.3]|uniref:acyl-CoA desaturase n=1 Tax=Janthinobacterium sp. CG_23.3 TaxID=3349634 RepID=UPI0038D50919